MLSSLVYWEDPVASGVLFGSVFVTLVSFSYYSLISVVSYLALFILCGVGAIKLYSKVMVMLGKAAQGSDPLEKVAKMPVTIPAESIQDISRLVADHANLVVAELRRLFLVENMVDTIKFGLSLWCLTYIGSWFNAITLVILGWVAVFSIPKLYVMNQAKVDEIIEKVKLQVDEVKGKVMAMVPLKTDKKSE